MFSEFTWSASTIAIIGAFLVPISAIISAAFVKATRTRALADLKVRLLEKGMSAEEIKTVVEAGEGADK